MIKNTQKKTRIRQEDRFAKIARLSELVFHAQDLASLWQIKNPGALHMLLSRYVKKGLLFRIYKGFYSIKPIEQIDPVMLGLKALHGFAYVSTETVLVQAGIIQQNIHGTTFVSARSKKFSIGDNHYYSRKLKDSYLFQSAGIIDERGIKTATTERAVADLLYFNSKAYFDGEKLIDWKKIKQLQKEIGYPLTLERYDK